MTKPIPARKRTPRLRVSPIVSLVDAVTPVLAAKAPARSGAATRRPSAAPRSSASKASSRSSGVTGEVSGVPRPAPSASKLAAKLSGALPKLGHSRPMVVLLAGKDKSLLRRHPWVFAGAIATVRAADSGRPEPLVMQPGELVDVVSNDGRWLASGGYCEASSIRVRCLSFSRDEVIDAAWVTEKIAAAIARRAGLIERTDARRLVFGEADGLPGLIVDHYGPWAVMQILSAAMELWRDAIVAAIQAAGFTQIYERSEASARQKEGLEAREGVVLGQAPAGPMPMIEDGVHHLVDIVAGHKTGAYLDQRDNRELVMRLAQGKRVLNCFCYTGGFSHAARRGGAASVVSVDSSEPALAQAREIELLNLAQGEAGSSGQEASEWIASNAFDLLKSFERTGRVFDLIVLDPPKFAPSQHHLDKAARAYKELNLKAMQLLAPGGLLLTFSCSGAVSVELFQKIVAGAVIDAGVQMQLLKRLEAGSDHPMLMTHPEGEYLKGLMLARV